MQLFTGNRGLAPDARELAEARGIFHGKVSPSSRGSTTAAALRAFAASSSHRVTGDRGAYDFSALGTTCFEVELRGPGGVTPVAVQITDEPGPSRVAQVGLRPPANCGRNGRMTNP